MHSRGRRAIHRVLAAAFLALFFLGNAGLHRGLSHRIPSRSPCLFSSFIALEQFMEKNELGSARLHVSDIGFTEGLWLAFFLRHAELAYDRFINNFLYSLPIDFRYKEKGWFIENTNTLVDLWGGQLVNEAGIVTFYQQRSDAPYTLVRATETHRYLLDEEIYSNPHYALLKKKEGNLCHINFYDGTFVFEAPITIDCSPSSLSIAGRSYAMHLPEDKPIGILIQAWGDIHISPESAVLSVPPYYLLELPAHIPNMAFQVLPHGQAALVGSLNLIDRAGIPRDLLKRLPRIPPWKPVLPESNVLLIDGCHALEKGEGPAWRWTTNRALFYLEPRVGPSVLSLHFSASPVVDQMVAVRLDGEELARIKLKAGQEFECAYRVNGKASGDTGSRLILDISETFQPHAFNGMGDTRDLGVCLRSLTFEPAGNAHAH